jgi:hypothetical protein
MGFHDEYDRFRNYLMRFDLVSSLIDVWCYGRHITDDRPLEPGYAVGFDPQTMRPLKECLHPWDLDILARELVLNAGSRPTYSLRWWNDLAGPILYNTWTEPRISFATLPKKT